MIKLLSFITITGADKYSGGGKVTNHQKLSKVETL